MTEKKRLPRGASMPTLSVIPSNSEGVSQRVKAYQGFTQHILSGGIRSGQFISQRELTVLLGMPLGAVREMIPRLEAGGLVKTIPKRGLQITHVDLKLIRNAFQVREMIEREAILRFTHSASDEELDVIEVSHRDMLRRASSGKIDNDLLDDTQALDWGVHDRMVDALGNEIISEIYRVNSLRLRLIRLDLSVINTTNLVRSMEEHLRFILALKQRDGTSAMEHLSRHIRNSRDRVINAPSEP